jgi:27-O-demethylrifamycin SV methyltransferase
MLSASTLENARHYDRVLDAWNLLLGRNLHYGCFETGSESLDEATL